MQDCSISSAILMVILRSITKPSISIPFKIGGQFIFMAPSKIDKSQLKVSCVCVKLLKLLVVSFTRQIYYTDITWVSRRLKTLAILLLIKSFVVLTKKKPINMCINGPLCWKSIGYPWVFPAKWSSNACPYHRVIIIPFTPKNTSLIARFMGPAWGPSGADRTKVGPMLAPWTLVSVIRIGECVGL